MTKSNLKHLAPFVRGEVRKSEAKRLSFLMADQWFTYPKAAGVLKRLEATLYYLTEDRPGTLVLMGDPGNGKTSLAKRFVDKHPIIVPDGLEHGECSWPVILVDMPSGATEHTFWNAVLRALRVPLQERSTLAAKETQATELLTSIGLRMLIIDEFHNILHPDDAVRRTLLETVRKLLMRLEAAVTLVGTRDALAAFQQDIPLTSRFEVVALPRWTLDRDFARMLVTFERLLPLAKPSRLATPEPGRFIYTHCGGTIGGVAGWLRRAAEIAIRSGEEQITMEILEQARLKVHDPAVVSDV
jgi:hypothetical protein